MEKTARLRKMVKEQSTYDAIMRAYKEILREGNKRKLYRLKGMLYACLNADNDASWRKVDDFFGEENLPSVVKYVLTSSFTKTATNQEGWFGQNLAECIKRTI